MSNTLISKMDKNILTNVEGPVYTNHIDPSKPVLKSMMFYGYNIKYFDFEYGQMFVVADLILQYCKNNNKSRINFTNFLRLNKTKDVIRVLTEEYYTRNSIYYKNLNDDFNKINIPRIIEYNSDIKYYKIFVRVDTYVICEKLLNVFLTWLDPNFATKASHFLEYHLHHYFQNNLNIYETSIKQLTNDTKELHKEIERLNNDNKALTLHCNTALNRSVKNISKESFCSYIYVRGFVYDEFKTSVIISHGFRNQLQLPANIRNTTLVLINNMPSGHQYRNQIKNKMLDVLEDYNGVEYISDDEAMTIVSKNKSNTYVNTFAIPVEKYTNSTMIILDIDGKYKGKHPSFDFKISIPNNELVLDFIDMSNSLIVDNHWNEAFVKNYNDLN